MHVWGDEFFKKHGKDLNDAIDYCQTVWTRYGRIGSSGSKEKWGTFRHNVDFYYAYWPIHELLKPGYHYYRYGRRLMILENYLGYIVRFLRLDYVVRKWQAVVYNYAIQKVCRKYPEIIDELVVDSDYPELIKPGIFGKVDGQVIHNKYWTKGEEVTND